MRQALSALGVIAGLLQEKADWRSHCLSCEGAPEVLLSCRNLTFFFCKACTTQHLEVLLDNSYRITGGPDAAAYVVQLAENKMR